MSTETNKRGNAIERDFFCMRDRYHYDFGQMTAKNGWKQYDTDQDASYFGVWVNIEKRQTFTFCEGDTTLVTCSTNEALQAELDDMADCYGELPHCAIGIGQDGSVTKYYDQRPTL